ncbi:MAG TPA: hypothetical protein VG605_11960 [Puia sp.]|nr:hypothetical protein [Puia sp.]
MTFTQEDFQRAKRISAAIQEFLRQTGMKDARTTDVYEMLARKGLIEKDRHQGYHFRKFLSRLRDANVLMKVIPQCAFTTNERGENEWHFHLSNRESLAGSPSAEKKATVIHQPSMSKDEIITLIHEERINVEELPVRTDKHYTPQETSIKNNYPRAYEYWSQKEYLILERVYLKCKNVEAVATLLQRQPHIVREKLEAKGMLD